MELNEEEVKKLVREVGLIPVTSRTTPKEIIMDINLLPEGYKDLEITEAVKKYNKDFGVKIIPLDMSRQNTDNMPGTPKIIVL